VLRCLGKLNWSFCASIAALNCRGRLQWHYTWWFWCACREKAPSREVEFQEYFREFLLWRAPISCANEQLHHDFRHISFNDCSIMIIRKLVLQLQPENGWKKSRVSIHSLNSKIFYCDDKVLDLKPPLSRFTFLAFLAFLAFLWSWYLHVLEPLGTLQIKCVEANVSHWKTWFESHSQHHDSKEASTLVAPQYKRRTKTPCCQPAHQPCNISLSVLEFSSMLHWKPLSSLGGDPNPHHRLLHIPKWNLICTTIPCAIQGISIAKLH